MAIEAAADLLPAKVAMIGVLGVGAQWVAWRLRWPAIVLMSVAGLMVGPVAAGVLGQPLLDPQEDFGELLRPIIGLAVAVILFEGGLLLDKRELSGLSKAVRRLVFPGALIGWLLGALAARYAAGLSWELAALFGGLLVVTGPTVILPLLRQSKLAGRPAAILKWEGIVNDPVGALLAVLVYEVIRVSGEGGTFLDAAMWLAFGASIGAALGWLSGRGLVAAFQRGAVPEYLKAPAILAAVLACFTLSDMVAHETGLLAVTVFGITVANGRLASIDDMRRFKETIATLLVSGVFVILTATLTLETIALLDWRAAAFVAAMLFLVRPATVWLSTIDSGLTPGERTLVGWIAPRGIVAVAVAGFFANELSLLYATQAADAVAQAQNALTPAAGEALLAVAAARQVQADQAASLIPLTFAMVFATVLLHGFTIGPLARRLGLAATGPEGVLIVGATPWSLALATALKEQDVVVTLVDSDWLRLRKARQAGIDHFHGEVLSETTDHHLDHARYGWVIAASANDAYNSLVSVEFAPELGRHRVYQLATGDAVRGSHEIARTARGRTLIREERGFDALTSDLWRGWRFRATTLTEAYDLERFFEERGQNVDVVLERRPDGRIQLLNADVRPKGGPGVTLIWFAEPKEDAPAEPASPKAEAEETSD